MKIPDVVRRRAEHMGEHGRAWLGALPEVVEELCEAWSLAPGEPLTGGSEALLLEVQMQDSVDAVLKIPLTDPDYESMELRALLLAQGEGYGRVLEHRHDAPKAWVMERLGPSLASLEWPPMRQMEAVCAALARAWRPLDASERVGFTTGAQKADGLAAFIEEHRGVLDGRVREEVVDAALERCAERRDAFDPETSVLGHGDPHTGNTLLVPGSEPERFVLVDPDGLFIDRAYDLGVLMREWSTSDLGGAPVEVGRQWCEALAALTSARAESIWAWASIERVTTAIVLVQLGMEDEARRFLEVAEAWHRAGSTSSG